MRYRPAVDPAQALVRARTQAGLTQRQAAAAAGVAQPTLARVESGKQQPSFPVLQRLLAGTGHRAELVIEELPDSHDLGLLEVTLALTPQQRVDRLVRLHRTARALRRAVLQ
jgi:transcriptional regulator with XRE-family HTH domain